jgi:sterol 3beta-glucosyltransferase
MKITISSHGTRGDIQPYLALALGLQHAGHQVTLATSYNYSEWIQSYGVAAHPTRFSLQEYMRGPEWQDVRESGSFLKQFRLFNQAMRMGAENVEDVWEAIQGADYVIQSPASSGALEAAELFGKPAALAYPGPFTPTGDFPSFFIGPARFSLGRAYNRLTHAFMHRMLWSMMSGPMTNTLRKKLDLSRVRSYSEQLTFARETGIPSLYGFSEHVLPRPKDWDDTQHITGYWFLDAPSNWRPQAELLQFLESGPPPIYLGFGSMDAVDTGALTRLILKALEMTAQRGVLLTGWGGLTRLPTPPNILFVDEVPHDWLFPRMGALVHHGGAGTTGAGLRAGMPNIIAPLGADQFAWAERVVELGVGPAAAPVKRITADQLAQAIDAAVSDRALRARAAAIGEKIRAEDGIARAVELIERHARTFNYQDRKA